MVTYEMMCGQAPVNFYSEDGSQKHKNIIQMPLHINSRAQDLLEKLLQDKNNRLGDAKDIKAHMFFNSINWDYLFDKRLKPPFNPPPVKDTLKLGDFGSELTAVAISGAQGVPCVSIADDTFNVMN